MTTVLLSKTPRGEYAAEALRKRGVEATCADTLSTLAPPARIPDVLVLPIPLTRDGITVNGVTCTERGEALSLSQLSETLTQWHELHGAMLTVGYSASDLLHLPPYPACTLASCNAFLLENARLTAEGGVAQLLAALPCIEGGISLSACEVHVLGFGRIARMIVPMLAPLSACVTVYARRADALRDARACGAFARPLAALASPPSVQSRTPYRVLVNTVPDAAPLLRATEALSPTVLLELAATKDVRTGAAAFASCPVIDGAAMPTRQAAHTAGLLLADAVLSLCSDRK